AIAHHVGDHRHRAEGHLAEVDVRVADRRCDRKRLLTNRGDSHATAEAIALPTSSVLAVPAISRVRGPSINTSSMALTIASSASFRPRCSSIIPPAQTSPIGFAIPFPALSGAQPWTASQHA